LSATTVGYFARAADWRPTKGVSMQVDGFEHGVPSWVDHGTTDLDKSVAFYSELFGWQTQDMGEQAGHYHIALLRGLAVAGIGPLMDGSNHSRWTTYVNVDDADEIAERITKEGGTVVFGPMDVMDQGRMAIAIDPAGGAIGIWQPAIHKGAQLVNEAGAYTWSHLLSRDFDKAVPFYTSVFGWGTQEDPENSSKSFTVNGRAVCGGMQMPAEVPAEVPSYWEAYFVVPEVDAATKQITDLGGTINMTMDMPTGRIASALDNVGAAFGIAEMNS
jgi:predicted enzyme related to lactoylglutathione lyase